MTEWLIEPLDKRAVSPKRRRSLPGSPQPLDSLPPMLAELAAWMAEHGEKGEQEGYL